MKTKFTEQLFFQVVQVASNSYFGFRFSFVFESTTFVFKYV